MKFVLSLLLICIAFSCTSQETNVYNKKDIYNRWKISLSEKMNSFKAPHYAHQLNNYKSSIANIDTVIFDSVLSMLNVNLSQGESFDYYFILHIYEGEVNTEDFIVRSYNKHIGYEVEYFKEGNNGRYSIKQYTPNNRIVNTLFQNKTAQHLTSNILFISKLRKNNFETKILDVNGDNLILINKFINCNLILKVK